MWIAKGSKLINTDKLLDIHVEKDPKVKKYFLIAAGQNQDYCLDAFTDVNQADFALRDLEKLIKAYRIPKEEAHPWQHV